MRIALLFLFLLAGLSAGQSPLTNQILRERALRQVIDQAGISDQTSQKRRDEAYLEQDFERKANRVVVLWNAVIADRRRHLVNVKRLRDLDKAFHDLGRGEGWFAQ